MTHGAGPDGPVSPVYRVDGNTGAVTDLLRVGQHASYFYASETADRERFFLTSVRDNRTWELDPDPLRIVRSWPVGDAAGAVSPDGRVFALAPRQAGSGCSIWTPEGSGRSEVATMAPWFG